MYCTKIYKTNRPPAGHGFAHNEGHTGLAGFLAAKGML